MPLYESVFIIRQDVSSAEVEKITNSFSELIKEQGGRVVKNEYWGLRHLAYEIHNNRKGHYIMLGLEASPVAMKEYERKMKLNEDIIRFLNLKVEAISDEPSPILKAAHADREPAVNVTSNKI